MKKLILVILAITTVYCHAQKCVYDVDKYDKFSKVTKHEKEVKVNKANAGGDGYLKINFCKYDSLTFFRITYIKANGIVVGQSDALIFLLEDESTVKAHPMQIYSGESRGLTGNSQSVLYASYNFDNSGDIEKLKSQKVKSIRIFYNSVYKDHEIKDKFSDAIYRTVQCF